MIKQIYKDIVTDDLIINCLDNNSHPGFLEDYRCITALLRIFKPISVFEIGTNTGNGVNTIKAALPGAIILSLDLDYESMMLNKKEFPIGPNGEDRVGNNVKGKYLQLRGDSMKFDYSKYLCQAYFIDGCHDYDHPKHETKEILKNKPNLIIYHDADIDVVYKGIMDAFNESKEGGNYELYRVIDTRIAYAVRK